MKRFATVFMALSALAVAGIIMSSCGTSIGLARLPSKDQLFVSTSSEEGFILSGNLDYPYQPIGWVKLRQTTFTPCMSVNPLKGAYEELEKAMVEKLADKAVNEFGADGLIAMEWWVVPGILTNVVVKGLAVKKK